MRNLPGIKILTHLLKFFKSRLKVRDLLLKRRLSNYFDSNFYLRSYPDVLKSGIEPLEHYIKYGYKEGRSPFNGFDSGFYLSMYPDVRHSGMNPLDHYIKFGSAEKRKINRFALIRNYAEEIRSAGFRLPNDRDAKLKVAEGIRFQDELTPLVSVIIPIYGSCEYTLQCLYSLYINKPKLSFEIIVVDDCSPDSSAEIIGKIPGIRLIKNDVNLGFIRSCNYGSKFARGSYLCFLNNDTYVLPGWLDELIDTFSNFSNVGLVGSKLLYPNGLLQEAGGIIWRDGSAWNYGRDQNPSLPDYSYAREVDYCSGASIVVAKGLFDSLNGFDEHFLPAYCEDSDLALKIRDLGCSVIYQPFSEVIHFEGVTSGTDVNAGVKSYQLKNSAKLFERWKSRLELHRPSGVDPLLEKDRGALKRVLVLEVTTPTPDCDAGSVTDINLMILLREMGFKVTFIATDNFHYDEVYSSALQKIGIEVLYRPYTNSVYEHLQDFGAIYDLVFLFRPQVAQLYLDMVLESCPKAKTLYYPHDLHYLRAMREFHLSGNEELQLHANSIKQSELHAINEVDIGIMVSEHEKDIIQQEVPLADLQVFPLVLNIPGTNIGFDGRSDLIFIGGFNHSPNVDAAIYFVTEVMPILRKKLPGIKLHIVGSNPTEYISRLASGDVIIHGFVKELNDILEKIRVSIVPLRYGAGVKGKVGTSMAAGVPVVTSPIGAEGMNLQHKISAMIADSPEEFADAITDVYLNPDLWKSLSINGIEFAERSWGANAAWDSFSAILKSLGFNVPARPNKLQLYKQ